MIGDVPVTRSLPSQTLRPLEAQQVDLRDAVSFLPSNDFMGMINLAVSFTGQGRDLMIATGSVDQTGSYVFEVEPQGVGKSGRKIGNYWNVSKANNTMLSLWNPSDQAEDLVVTLYYGNGSGQYKLPVHLAANGSTMIDIKDLIMRDKPDADANIIPPNVEEGSASFESAKGRMEEFTAVISGGVFNVITATCGTSCVSCCGQNNISVSPQNWICPINEGMGFTPTVRDCSGAVINVGGQWGSSNTGIATVNSSGYMTPVSEGADTISFYINGVPVYTGQMCAPYPSCPTGNPGGSASGNIHDPTPNITGISPGSWNAGASTSVQITGTGFGTSPSLSITDPNSGITGVSISSSGDTYINATVTISASTPAENATVTVTSNGYGHGFISQGNSPTSPAVYVPVNPIPAPAPHIVFNGSNVEGTTQSVVVGQQIALNTTIPGLSPLTVSSQSWSVDGTVVGGYTATESNYQSATLTPISYSNSSITFYWVVPAQGLRVTYTYTASNGTSQSSTATFNVSGPTCSAACFTGTFSDVTISNSNPPCGSTVLCLALGSSSAAGIAFNGSATVPGGYPNSFFYWVQTITNDQVATTDSTTGQRETCHPATQPPTGTFPGGLDTQYPYSKSTATSSPYTEDSPTFFLSGYSEVSRSFQATMFLLWSPGIANSIPVPLGYITWQFSGDAVLNLSTNTWSLASKSKSEGNFQPASSYPTWSYVVTYPLFNCQ